MSLLCPSLALCPINSQLLGWPGPRASKFDKNNLSQICALLTTDGRPTVIKETASLFKNTIQCVHKDDKTVSYLFRERTDRHNVCQTDKH